MATKFGIQSPLYRKATTAEIIGGIVMNVFVGVVTTAIGIDLYNKKKAAKAAKKGGTNNE